MRTTIRFADPVREVNALVALDRQIFLPSDCFEPETWQEYKTFWVLDYGIVIGAVALGINVEFGGDWGR
jgi:hypothetical protein